MKKLIRGIALILALVMCFGLTAFAAEDLENDKATIENKLSAGEGTVTFYLPENATEATDNEERIVVTYNNPTAITSEGQYLILMVTGDGSAINTDTEILYIDQVMDKDDGKVDGTIRFTVYPSQLQTGTILITGTGITPTTDKLGLIAAVVNGKYMLGDVDSNGYINVDDALLILQYVVGISNLTDAQMMPANTDGNAYVNVDDAMLILQLVVGIITEF